MLQCFVLARRQLRVDPHTVEQEPAVFVADNIETGVAAGNFAADVAIGNFAANVAANVAADDAAAYYSLFFPLYGYYWW